MTHLFMEQDKTLFRINSAQQNIAPEYNQLRRHPLWRLAEGEFKPHPFGCTFSAPSTSARPPCKSVIETMYIIMFLWGFYNLMLNL